jgi:hypothetical protein
MADFKIDPSYVDVAARIVEFRTKYPEGSLQPADLSKPYTIQEIGDATYVVVVAAAYRTADDQRPGIGMAYEVFPGRTPYTRGSELQNAETSAWGRAIVAVGAADTKRGVASAEDVRNRQAERDQPADVSQSVSDWREAIQSADTAEDLQKLASDLAGSALSSAARAPLKEVWTARMQELQPS